MKRTMYIIYRQEKRDVLENGFERSFDVTTLGSHGDIVQVQKQRNEKVDVVLFDANGMSAEEAKSVVNTTGLPQFQNTAFIAVMEKPFPKLEELFLRCKIDDVIYESMTLETVRLRVEKAMKHRYMGHDVNDTYAGVIKAILEKWGLESKTHLSDMNRLTKIFLAHLKEKRPDCLTDSDIEMIARASILHDIGKIMIPADVLMKPGKLTETEFEIVKSHAACGCGLLMLARDKESRFYRYCYEISRYHHERWDGSGYPDKLEGDEIPLCAQAVGILDVYDSLISKKIYKDAIPREKALDLIISGKCGSFSPEMLECLERCRDEFLAM